MLQADAVQLYDLSEAGRLLYRDPVRLAREARLRQVPAARAERQLGLPVPWVEAESGRSAADPEALRIYWLGRLAPPSPDARRPQRDRARLPVEDLLEPEEAARRIFATPAALRRLDADGTLPSLRVDDRPLYDAVLTGMVASEGAAGRDETEARRAEVLEWARFEYHETAEEEPLAPAFDALRTAEPGGPPPAASDDPTPGAYEIPSDLLADIEPPPSRLIEADGFETVDED